MIKLTATEGEITFKNIKDFLIDGKPLESFTLPKGSTIHLNQ